jgi:branched-subunit amino acid aminotransferase/4-amino-4-deoxychorismate lyase
MAYDTHICIGREGVVSCDTLPFDAVSLGQGVFETILFLKRRGVLWERHVARLAASCEALSIASAGDAERIAGCCLEVVAGMRRDAARVRLAVFGAPGTSPAAVVSIGEYVRPRESARLSIGRARRPVDDVLARHKTVSYLANLRAKGAATAAGFDDSLTIDSEGNVAETTTANIFVFSGGRIITPRTTCALPGIVRSWVLDTASDMGIDCGESDIPEGMLDSCEAAFVTNSIIGLAPVSCIDDRALAAAGHAAFGALSEAYSRLLESTAQGEAAGAGY